MLKALATVGSATLMSRVLGFFRDVLIANAIGTGAVADAFFVAFRVPNLFRRLFAEGAFNSAFIPLYAEAVEEGGAKGARRYAEDILSALAFVLFVVSALIEIIMPAFILLNAPGFSDQADKFDVTVLFSRVMFPYLFCMAIVAMLSGMLNTIGKFAAAAFAPVLLNVVLISILLVLFFLGEPPSVRTGLILSWGVLLAGFAQLLMLVWATHKSDIRLDLRWPRFNHHTKKLLKLGVPGVIAGGITQVNIFIGTIIASQNDGAVSYLYYADRLYQLPLGVIGIAIGVVLLPTIARKIKAGDEQGAHSAMNTSLEISMLLTLPAAVALIVMPAPVISVLFERGAFSSFATEQTAMALMAFAVGLPAFVLIKVFAPGFFARQDTKTPMYFAGASVGTNIALSLLLFPHMGHIGIALATSVAGWVNALLLWYFLGRSGIFTLGSSTMKRLSRQLVAALLMGAALAVIMGALQSWFDPQIALVFRLGVLAGVVVAGVAIFFVLGLILRAYSLKQARAAFQRR